MVRTLIRHFILLHSIAQSLFPFPEGLLLLQNLQKLPLVLFNFYQTHRFMQISNICQLFLPLLKHGLLMLCVLLLQLLEQSSTTDNFMVFLFLPSDLLLSVLHTRFYLLHVLEDLLLLAGLLLLALTNLQLLLQP